MFRIEALPLAPFLPLLAGSDAELAAQGAARVVADAPTGYPCRVSLTDATPGEMLVLLPWPHQDHDTPYRASGPVFVRQLARQATPQTDEVPAFLLRRSLSVRAYDQRHWIVAARVCTGQDLAATATELFADPRVGYLHLHSPGYGCYLCRVLRA